MKKPIYNEWSRHLIINRPNDRASKILIRDIKNLKARKELEKETNDLTNKIVNFGERVLLFAKYKNYIIGILYIYLSVVSTTLFMSTVSQNESVFYIAFMIFTDATVYLLGAHYLYKELK